MSSEEYGRLERVAHQPDKLTAKMGCCVARRNSSLTRHRLSRARMGLGWIFVQLDLKNQSLWGHTRSAYSAQDMLSALQLWTRITAYGALYAARDALLLAQVGICTSTLVGPDHIGDHNRMTAVPRERLHLGNIYKIWLTCILSCKSISISISVADLRSVIMDATQGTWDIANRVQGIWADVVHLWLKT
jgi:hypothetical protein